MFQQILLSILHGFVQSLNVIKLSKLIYRNKNLRQNVIKLIKHNSIFYLLPGLLIYLMGISPDYFSYIYIPIEIFSSFIHLLYYFDISNIVNNSIVSRSKKSNSDSSDPITGSITMALYQFTMIVTISINDIFIVYINIYLSYLIKFLLLSMYHAVFSHNNLWQNIGLNITQRIDIYQKMWPYYFGYGIIASMMYIQTNIFIKGIYNIYIGILISIALLNKMVLPTSKITFPELNLKMIEYIMSIIFNIVSSVAKIVFKLIQ